jgi:microcystin-dependent protein
MRSLYPSCVLSMAAIIASAQSVPSLINYQGRLTDQAGTPLTLGNYVIQFRLWDSPTATNGTDLVWAQQQAVAVRSNGAFNVILDAPDGTALQGVTPAVNDLSYAFAGNSRFLGLTVVAQNGVALPSPTEIQPRQQLLSVPFAIQAATISAATAESLSPPGQIAAFGGSTTPGGWLLCDGTALSSVQYPRLHAAIGTNWGAGDVAAGGTHDFSLPDLRGLFLRGVLGSATNSPPGTTNLVDPDVLSRVSSVFGGNRGNAVGSVQPDQLGRHQHNFGVYSRWYGGVSSIAFPSDAISGPDGTSATAATGGSETRPKNAYVNYIIKY